MFEYSRRHVTQLKDNPLFTRTVTLVDQIGRSFLVCREEFDEYISELTDQMELDIYGYMMRV